MREPGEREINDIAGSISMPMGELATRSTELSRELDIVVFCKVGERSGRAAEQLQRLGSTRVFNLAGGIARWAEDVDEDIGTY